MPRPIVWAHDIHINLRSTVVICEPAISTAGETWSFQQEFAAVDFGHNINILYIYQMVRLFGTKGN